MSPLSRLTFVADGPRKGRRAAFGWPGWLALLICLSFLLPAGAEAQKRRRRNKRKKQKPVATVKEKKTKKGKVQNFDFTGLSLGASMRTPQLLYFLDRASEELKRASLQRRSFVPEMVRSISEEGL